MGLVEKKIANNRYRKFIPDTISDPITEFLKWDYDKIGNKNISKLFRIIRTTEFNNDYRNSYDKDTVNRIINNLSLGFIYSNSPGNKDWTTYIAKYSNEGRLAYEKRINPDQDRLTYYIEKPFLSKDKMTGTPLIVINIRLSGCIGHKFNDSAGNARTFSKSIERGYRIKRFSKIKIK